MNSPLSIIILAAGKGTRMKSSKQKVLQKIANREMVLHVIAMCNRLNYKKIFIVLGKNNSEIKNILPKNVEIIIQENQLGTAHALLCAKNKLKNQNGKLLILYADVPFLESSTIKKLINKNEDNISMLGFECKNPKGYGRIILKNKKVFKIVEEKNLHSSDKNISLCYSGIFSGNIKTIFRLLSNVKKNKVKEEFLLTDIFGLANRNNITTYLITTNEMEVMGINNMLQLSLAEEYYQDKLRNKFLKKGIMLQLPNTIYFSYDTKIGSNVKIGAHNYFGVSVTIKNKVNIGNSCNVEEATIFEGASIGPFSRIRNNSIIFDNAKIGNFVEMKNSKLGKNSKVNHLAYIGDTTIGNNTNIGAGTITCNYDGKKKHRTIIGSNVFIGSNTSLIAPIKIADKAFIAAGSTISENLNTEDFSIARAKQKIIKKGRKRFLK